MASNQLPSRSILFFLLLAPLAATAQAPSAGPQQVVLVKKALAAELRAAQDTGHPMRYRLRKSSPRLTTTKDIVETREGAVARLMAINDKPLTQAEEQREQARLNSLLANPGLQRHRKQGEGEDTQRALKVLRALPRAFIYQFAGAEAGPEGTIDRFTFVPNPGFEPPDLETQALTAMAGTVWIDPNQTRIVRLEGHLQQDVDFGWGILGRLNKGGWIRIEQASVADGQWRIVHFQMVMSGRVLLKNKVFNTEQNETHFTPVPPALGYAKAIQLLRAAPVLAQDHNP